MQKGTLFKKSKEYIYDTMEGWQKNKNKKNNKKVTYN